MFKIVKKTTFDKLMADLAAANERCEFFKKQTADLSDEMSEMLTAHVKQLDALRQANIEALAKVDEYIKADISSAQENTVRLVISPDLQKITPYVKYRADAFEALFQEGMLTDAQAESPHAIQLAIMTIGADGLNQLIESFEETIAGE